MTSAFWGKKGVIERRGKRTGKQRGNWDIREIREIRKTRKIPVPLSYSNPSFAGKAVPQKLRSLQDNPSVAHMTKPIWQQSVNYLHTLLRLYDSALPESGVEFRGHTGTGTVMPQGTLHTLFGSTVWLR